MTRKIPLSVFNSGTILRSRSLFWELYSPGYQRDAIFTIEPEDKQVTLEDGTTRTLISLFDRYMKECDPNEHTFATKWFYSWEHWNNLTNSHPKLADLVNKCRKELEMRLRSEAFFRLLDVAKDPGSKNYVEANKYINSVKWTDPEERKERRVGRPNKITGSSKESQRLHAQIDQDLQRITNGNKPTNVN